MRIIIVGMIIKLLLDIANHYHDLYFNCLVIACPLSESTLKLLVSVGNIKNATMVVSLSHIYNNIGDSNKHKTRESQDHTIVCRTA